ncbi:hypothetical protein EV363DRAFT_1291382 [Boletus edulis]|nr:hypothetical protein EV363DRAFT_1291382 [Boletus edulis]
MSPDDIALENVIKQIEFSSRPLQLSSSSQYTTDTFIRKTFSSFQPSEGPFVLGYAMCFGLMGVLSVQCFDALPRRLVIYFTKFPNDRTWIRVLGKLASLAVVLLLETLITVFALHGFWVGVTDHGSESRNRSSQRGLSRGALGRERDTCTWAIARSAVTITLITASSDADGVGVISCAAGLAHQKTTSANRIGNSQTVTSCGVVKQQRSMFAGSDKLVSPLFVLLNCGR